MANIRVSSIKNPFSSTICRNIYRYKSFSGSIKSFCSLPYLRKGSIRQSLRVGRQLSCCKTFKRPLNAKKTDSEDGEEEEDEDEGESKAVETVLQLYTDIKNKNMKGVAEVIGDECYCFCNFLSTFRSLHGKKQVLAFFYWLMKMLGENARLVVKPSSKNGLTVGVHWRLGSVWLSVYRLVANHQPLGMGEAEHSSGERVQLPHLPCLSGEATDKESRDVHGANLPHGTYKTQSHSFCGEHGREDEHLHETWREHKKTSHDPPFVFSGSAHSSHRVLHTTEVLLNAESLTKNKQKNLKQQVMPGRVYR